MAGQLLLLAQQNIATSNGEKHICEENFFIFLQFAQFFNDDKNLFVFIHNHYWFDHSKSSTCHAIKLVQDVTVANQFMCIKILIIKLRTNGCSLQAGHESDARRLLRWLQIRWEVQIFEEMLANRCNKLRQALLLVIEIFSRSRLRCSEMKPDCKLGPKKFQQRFWQTVTMGRKS